MLRDSKPAGGTGKHTTSWDNSYIHAKFTGDPHKIYKLVNSAFVAKMSKPAGQAYIPHPGLPGEFIDARFTGDPHMICTIVKRKCYNFPDGIVISMISGQVYDNQNNTPL